MKPIEIFLSYTHRDEALMLELEKHLSNLKQQGIIQAWHKQKITPGDEWEEEMDRHLNSAQIILLLISPDFLASDRYEVEVRRAMERHESKEARVIPVILRPADWEGALFSKLQTLPQKGIPITRWEDQDEAFLDVVKGIRSAIATPQNNIDELVQHIREQTSNNIQKRCGTMRVLDMEQPITIDSIYTNVNILEKISRNLRRNLDELLVNRNLEDFDRFSLGRRQERISGLEVVKRHDQLLILGKPGAGKTTFLKWLALQCKEGELHPNRIPIFVTLKEFAEKEGQPTLLEFIAQQLTESGIENAIAIVQQVLQAGRSLVLLDGLDEVRTEDSDRILNEIRRTSDQFDANLFVMTCRIASQEYTFEKFTEVEVADFDKAQIAEFADKWFQPKDSIKATEFPKALGAHPGLQELATNPLLLILLCLVYEEQAEFPANRSELYKEGLDVLLKQWDAKRNIRRQEVYKQLSLQRKEDLLSQIAFTTFDQSEYFFKQKFVEAQIQDYIRSLPNSTTDPEVLQLDSEAVLKSIEAQHGLLVERARGIYSFSHLTFQEYFTARQIKEKSEGDFGVLMSHITKKRWREIFLLTAGMLENADQLLRIMKQQIDGFLGQDENLQQFLSWVEQKSCSVAMSNKSATIRAFYLILAFSLDRARSFDRAKSLAKSLDLDREFGPDHEFDLAHSLDFPRDFNERADFLDLDLACALACALTYDSADTEPGCTHLVFDLDLPYTPDRDRAPEIRQKLQQFKAQLPLTNHWDTQKQWWRTNGQAWIAQLRDAMIQHRNIGHDWQFTPAQQERLQQYHDANKLLVDCLNSDCYVSREVREEIEATLLLPISSLQSRL